MTFRFLHSSDLHLGKAFGGYPEGIRNRLREARHGSIARLAAAARTEGAGVILLAGDTFDVETPAPETLRHALQAMAAEADLEWVLLPGNHDSLAASELWRRVLADAPANLRVVTDPSPFDIFQGVFVLPAPCTARRPGRDLTEAMSAPTPEGALRIGLGHGAVTDFSGEEGTPGIIPPDRARLSGLDYLALGDWHGCLRVGSDTWYSGTPETDAFKHGGNGQVLSVHLAKGRLEVDQLSLGLFNWQEVELDLLPGDEPAARLEVVLPPVAGRRDVLARVVARGRLPLHDLTILQGALDQVAPDFGWFAQDLSRLPADVTPADLDLIDRAGALRQAAQSLLTEAEDQALTAEDRACAAAALARLYAFAQEVQA